MLKKDYVPFSGKVGDGTIIYEPVVIVEAGHFITIGRNCRIGQFTFIGARTFVMDDEAEIGPQVTIGGGGDVHLGERSTINYGARLIPGTFSTKGVFMNDVVHQREYALTDMIRGSIIVGKGAYIGSNAVICISKKNPDIKIGDFAVIGALSYIDKNVPAYTTIHPYQTLHRRKRSPHAH